MDISIVKLFEETINWELNSIIISNSTDKEKISKVKIRPVLIKEELHFQASEYIGEKVFHTNYSKEELLAKLPDWFEEIFKQAEIVTRNGNATVLISKKGKATISNKIKKNETKSDIRYEDENQTDSKENLLHNKKKNYILQEGTPLPFLIDLGVMTRDAVVIKTKSDKFRQINRFLEYIEDVLPYLDHDRELTILDFGCGKSYLTFAMYYYLKILKGYQINVIGLDLKKDVISQCNLLSEKYGYEKLHFLEGDIASYTGKSSVDMVVTLHACDTATDHALYKACSWGAKVILSVPCCQHELNKQIANEILKPVLKYGIVKEKMAALITDALRAELLETKGYKVQLLEFIDMEHTPKNILIRAVKMNASASEGKDISDELQKCMEFLGVSPCLHQLFQGDR
ncbi:MAG TPA: SAM-dependent methyltransferase [Mobilitalea sp.]|nr:SAM-dependent methyltransferase [Mobilitalea sp.]